MRNEYKMQKDEVAQLQDERYKKMGIKQGEYDYAQQIKNTKSLSVTYQKIKVSDPPLYAFENQLIFKPELNNDYVNYAIETLNYKEQEVRQQMFEESVPTPAVARRKGISDQIDERFGGVIEEGQIQAKKHFTGQINQLAKWEKYYYVLRKYTFYFYASRESDSQQFKCQIMEKSIDTNMQNMESFAVTDNFYVKTQKSTNRFRDRVTNIAYWRSYLMIYALRDQPPDKMIREFVQHNQNYLIMENLKPKPNSKTFKHESQIVFTFLNTILEKISSRTNMKHVELYFPKDMLYMQNFLFIKDPSVSLKTNVIPPKGFPLQQLHLVNVYLDTDFVNKLKVHLPDIFPRLDDKDNTHRVFSLTNSNLDDNFLSNILKGLNRPLKQLNFSHNRLSSKGINYMIQAAHDLETNVLDASYNQQSGKIMNTQFISLVQSKAQCVKVLKLRGSSIIQVGAMKFFHTLAESHWLNQIHLDYEPYYNIPMVERLKDFNCEMLA